MQLQNNASLYSITVTLLEVVFHTASKFRHHLSTPHSHRLVHLPAAGLNQLRLDFFHTEVVSRKVSVGNVAWTFCAYQTWKVLEYVISFSRDKDKPCSSVLQCPRRSRTLPRVHWSNPSLLTWAGPVQPAWMSSRLFIIHWKKDFLS